MSIQYKLLRCTQVILGHDKSTLTSYVQIFRNDTTRSEKTKCLQKKKKIIFKDRHFQRLVFIL